MVGDFGLSVFKGTLAGTLEYAMPEPAVIHVCWYTAYDIVGIYVTNKGGHFYLF